MGPLTLNDFKAVLGSKNDGNVVFDEGTGGLQKANHGSKLTRAVHGYRVAKSDPTVNGAVRFRLMNAILASPEGKALSERHIEVLYGKILGDGNVLKDLTRMDLSDILGVVEGLQVEGGDIIVDPKTGKVKLAKAEGKPAFGNAIVARQKGLILARTSVLEREVNAAFTAWATLCDRVPAFKSAAGLMKAVPKGGIGGFSKAEVEKFIKGNFSTVQAQIADKVVWLALDALAAGKGKLVLPGDLFRSTILEMMEAYGRKEVPMPHAETLIAVEKAQPGEPSDLLAAEAFRNFRTELKTAFDALFGKPSPVDLKVRQQANFRTHAEKALLETFTYAYAGRNGTAEEKLKAARDAVGGALSFLKSLPADQVAALLGSPDVGAAFRTELESALKTVALDSDGKPSPADTFRALRTALDAVGGRLSLEPLVEAFLKKCDPSIDPAAARTNLLARLNDARNPVAAKVAALRARLLGTALAGQSLENKAEVLLQDETFSEIARTAIAGLESEERVREKRDALFAKIAEIPRDDANGRTYADGCLPTADEVDNAFKQYLDEKMASDAFKGLSLVEKSRIVDEHAHILAKVKAALEDKTFRGQVCMLVNPHFTVVRENEEMMQLFKGGSGVRLEPETALANIARIRKLANGMSIRDVGKFEVFLSGGLETTALLVSMQGEEAVARFLGLLDDDTYDFAGMDPSARKLFLALVSSSNTIKSGGIPRLFPYDVPQTAMRQFYAEMRAVVIARIGLDLGKPKETQKKFWDYLESVHMEAEEMPEGFSFSDLMSMSGVNGNVEQLWRYDPDGAMLDYPDFGTQEPARVFAMLSQAGITPESLKSPDSWMTMLKFQALFHAAGGKADGLVEWAERVTGKTFAQITLSDCDRLVPKGKNAQGKEIMVAIPDPLDALEGGAKTAAAFLDGRLKTGEAKFVAEELPALLGALKSLRSRGEGASPEVSAKLFGQTVAFVRRADGSLTAKLVQGEGKSLPIAVARSLDGLIRQIEDAVTGDIARFGADVVAALLPKPPQGDESVARPRELYARVLSSILGMPSAHFAHLTTADLAKTANEALAAFKAKGDLKAIANRFVQPPGDYNDAETVELQEKYLWADDLEKALVKLPPVAPGRSEEERKRIPPTDKEVRGLVADLFMNADTVAFDKGRGKPGQRLLTLLAGNRPELDHIWKDPDLQSLDTLPEAVRDSAKRALRELHNEFPTWEFPDDDATREKLDRFERLVVGPMMDAALEKLQGKAAVLFQAKGIDDRELWKKSLGDVRGAGTLDPNTPGGRFTLAVLQKYFTRCGDIEKRAMLSAFIRNSDKDSSDGAQVAETLKGAGPLLQKMLQGLPLESFDGETQKALKDMKSNLPPIPDDVIKAQLLELVRNSDGEILSVEVKRSIGQATVGQALLCHVRTKLHPVTGEDLVIKILRPNVQTAVQRERQVIAQIARELDQEAGGGTKAQEETFEGRYRSILEELDFTLEAENVDLGVRLYDNPKVALDDKQVKNYAEIHSMRRFEPAPPMTGMLVLEKVEGQSADRHLESLAGKREGQDGIEKKVLALPGSDVRVFFEAKDGISLQKARIAAHFQHKALLKQRKSVEDLLDVWIDRALFGDGVFHNDLHPGNVMVKGKDLTVIDYGNVMRLKPAEQSGLVFMCTAAMTGDAKSFVAAVSDLLPKGERGKLTQTKDGLLKQLEEVLAKGTAQDVLPRLLAGLALIQAHGAPVPEAVHNFAQSVARLQGVVESFDAQIHACEDFCARSFYSTGFMEKFSHPLEGGPTFSALTKLDELILSLGESGKSHSSADADVLFGNLRKSLTKKGEIARFAFGLDGVGKNVSDPLETGDTLGEAAKEMLKGLRDEVFKQDDGGVAYLNAFCDKYGEFISFDLDSRHAQAPRDRIIVAPLRKAVEEYALALKGDPRDPEAIAKCSREVEREMLSAVLDLASTASSQGTSGSLDNPAQTKDFLQCLGEALTNRQEALRNAILTNKDIPVKVFEEVMAAYEAGGIMMPVKVAKAAGGHLLALNELRTLAKQLAEVGIKAAKQARIYANMVAAADRKNADLAFEERVPVHQRRVLVSVMKTVCHPKGWKPTFATDKGKALFAEVIRNALATAREALRPETLSAAGVKYVARLMTGAFAEVGLSDFVRANEAAVSALIANAKLGGQEADNDLVAFLEVLRDEDYTTELNPPPEPEQE